MSQDEQEKSGGFVVKDRRRFNSDGQERAEEIIKPETTKVAAASDPRKTDLNGPKASPNQTESRSPSSNELNDQRKAEVKAVNDAYNSIGSSRSQTGQPTSPEEDDANSLNFSSFIISLATQASMQLGLVAPPPGVEIDVDLGSAKQTIDIIGLIEQKTRGNLNDQERQLLSNILHELRLGFVQLVKQSSSQKSSLYTGQ